VALFLVQVGVSARAPHPKAALFAANFLLSRQAQQFATTVGRIPVRAEVTPNPAQEWQRNLQDLFRAK